MDTDMVALVDEIAAAVRTLGLSAADFRLLVGEERAHVLGVVVRRYVQQPNRLWWWEVFRCRSFAVAFAGEAWRHWLGRLVEAPETRRVWFIAGVDEDDPALVYEGTVATVEAVLDACYGLEYYVVAHDYSWLACENHHGACYAVGFRLIRRLRTYVRAYPEHIFAQYATPRRPPDAQPRAIADSDAPPDGQL
jgi:hypothetical protein